MKIIIIKNEQIQFIYCRTSIKVNNFNRNFKYRGDDMSFILQPQIESDIKL